MFRRCRIHADAMENRKRYIPMRKKADNTVNVMEIDTAGRSNDRFACAKHLIEQRPVQSTATRHFQNINTMIDGFGDGPFIKRSNNTSHSSLMDGIDQLTVGFIIELCFHEPGDVLDILSGLVGRMNHGIKISILQLDGCMDPMPDF